MKKYILPLILVTASVSAMAANVWTYRNGATSPYGQYNTLFQAVNNSFGLHDNDIIEFHGNTSETQSSSIARSNIRLRSVSGQQFTASFASFALSDNGITIGSGGSLVLENITLSHYTRTGTFLKSMISVMSGGVLNVNGATLSDCSTDLQGAAVMVYQGGTMNVTGGLITRNTSINEGGAIHNRGTLNISGGVFSHNVSTNHWGGAICNTGTITITGGTFTQNSGAAVKNQDFVSCIISGTPQFVANDNLYGGAVTFESYSSGHTNTCEIRGGTFSGNTGKFGGGALTVRGQKDYVHLVISGGVFSGNTAVFGGVIDITSDVSVTITGAMFGDGNTATEKGGVINNRGTLTINGGEFSGNTAVLGGAIYQEGTMLISGAPAFAPDQTVFLPAPDGADEVSRSMYVITKGGDIAPSVSLPVVVANEVAGRDILVSSSPSLATASDLARLHVIYSSPLLAVAYTSNGRDGGGATPSVIEFIPKAVITIARIGDGSSATYSVWYKAPSASQFEPAPRYTVAKFGDANTPTSIVRLDPGTYKVEETTWNWAYEKAVPTAEGAPDAELGIGTATFSISPGQTVTLLFTGTKKPSLPRHGEDIKENHFP